MIKLCIIGMGNMGTAISEALSRSSVCEVLECKKASDANKLLAECDAYLVAVKPQDFDRLAEMVDVDLSGKLGISIMAGVSLEKFGRGMNCKKVVRVMPNLALKVGMSVSAWYSSPAVGAKGKIFIRDLLEVFGEELEVDREDQMDAVTALSGSGIAYYYYLNTVMRGKAQKFGFSDEDSRKIVRGTFLGSAKLLEETGETSSDMIRKIASKGGTTEAALRYLHDEGFDDVVGEAVQKAYRRAQDLT